jgi:hypothetical protein
MIPIEQWVEGYSIVFQIAVEIPLFVIFILLFPISFYIVGYINRFGVERISKTKQPNNRKWTILSGFIVYSIGWILIYNILGTTMMVEQPESYWIGILSFALINSIEWFCLFLVGVVGYIVALKLPIFRN